MPYIEQEHKISWGRETWRQSSCSTRSQSCPNITEDTQTCNAVAKTFFTDSYIMTEGQCCLFIIKRRFSLVLLVYLGRSGIIVTTALSGPLLVNEFCSISVMYTWWNSSGLFVAHYCVVEKDFTFVSRLYFELSWLLHSSRSVRWWTFAHCVS